MSPPTSFRYPAEKLAAARRNLMLPHPRGEAASIADAFLECSLGLQDVRPEQLDDNSRRWLATLRELMNTEGLTAAREVGTWHVKAESLSVEERADLSQVVDELADWFDRDDEAE